MNKSEMITELEISMQQKDTLEVELLGRTRENRILKNRLQELIDYGEGLDVKMPGQWSLEEQTTALRFMLKAAREEVRVEGNGKKIFDGKDLPNLARLAFTENEEQWREVRRLERKVAELTKHLDTLKENKGGKINYFGSNSTVDHPDSAADVLKCSGGKDSARMPDVNGERADESEVLNKSGKHVVTSSKAKLKKGRLCSESKSEFTLQNSDKLVDQLTGEELCDLQICLLDAGHELSQQEQLVVEEKTAKFNETDTAGNTLSNKEMWQPCQITLAGPSCGPTPGAVVRYARKYEGLSKIRVEEDGGVEGTDDRIDAKDETPAVNFEDELKSSLAVRVRRRGGK